VGSLVAVSVGLLAVVFASLAIVVALPASSYLKELGDTPDGGMRVFLDPFLVAAGAPAMLVLLTVGYGLVAKHVPAAVEHAAFTSSGSSSCLGCSTSWDWPVTVSGARKTPPTKQAPPASPARSRSWGKAAAAPSHASAGTQRRVGPAPPA
jgi:hypothetical protein